MRRPSDTSAIGFAAALGAAATIAVATAGLELANPHGDIWANSWTYVALSLGGLGLLITTVWMLWPSDRGSRNSSLHYGKNTWIRGLARPDGEAQHVSEDNTTGQVPDGGYAKSQTTAHTGTAVKTGPAEEAGTAGDTSRPSAPGNRAPGRQELATELEALAQDLTTTSRKLKRIMPGPHQDAVSVWRMGLAEVQECIERVDLLQAECQIVIDGESETRDKYDTTRPALDQFERAVTDAFGATLEAIDSLERPDQAFMPGSRNEYYIKAVDHLDELAARGAALAVHMRGAETIG